ncbi:MAG: hypothetical protein ABR511_14715 [Acidimicrobiales bacterium]
MPHDERPGRRRPRLDRAALASNWRQVLLTDAALGAAVILVGLVAAALVSGPIGLVVAAVGAAYLGLGLSRWRRWARLRAEAGLDRPGA